MQSQSEHGKLKANTTHAPSSQKDKVDDVANDSLSRKVIVVTGANQGIGKETVRGLAKTGAIIVLACRDQEKTVATIDELKAESQNNNLIFMKLDLSDLRSVKEFANEFKIKYQRLDILINNAGVFSFPEKQLTKNGLEMHFGTNYVGHFYLTTLLLDLIKNSAPSRIINLTSKAHHYGKIDWDDLNSERKYSMMSAYSNSKLAIVLFTKELQKRLESSNVKVVSVHPGVVNTHMNTNPPDKWYYKLFFKFMVWTSITSEQGAKTTLHCALEDHDKLKGGAYYVDSKIAKENPMVEKDENFARLWEETEKIIADKRHI